MAPRYGGDTRGYEALNAKLKEANALADAMAAKEAVIADRSQKVITQEEQKAKRVEDTTARRREARDAARRQAEIEGVVARDIDLTTAAVQRNTAAVRENIAARRQLAVDFNRALRGARDPLFGPASNLEGYASQHRLRQQYGIGGTRATTLQHALQSPLQAGSAGGDRPYTRLRAAQLAVEQSEAALAEATRQLASSRRRKAATDEERLAAADAREAAVQRRAAARLELESATKNAEAAAQERAIRRQAAIRQAEAAHQAAFLQQRAAAAGGVIGQQRQIGPGGPGGYGPLPVRRGDSGTDLILHPDRQGNYERWREEQVWQARQNERIQQRRANVRGRMSDLQSRDLGNLRETDPGREAAAEATRQHGVRQEEYTRVTARAAAQQRTMNAALREAIVMHNSASTAMMRHGALSSEFIQAFARGEVSVRELGNQALITAGKFGGWLAAGSGIYLAIDAMRHIGSGAVSAASGVAQLRRVANVPDSTGAMSDFAKLAQEFNVPVQTAADAVYQMGQRFHNEKDAVEAARASLAGMVAGNMELTDSTSSLISITDAFALGAGDLMLVMDQLNEAQNNFGATIPDTAKGLARAGGAFRTAGGDVNFLLGLMTAIQRKTRESGSTIGTAIVRGVNQFRTPSGRKLLEDQGVEYDPTNYQRTIQNAIKRAQDPGVDVQDISVGLFGKHYARLLPAILRDQELLNKVMRDTSPAKAQGSAMSEVQQVLREASEEIKQVGINLQALGAELAASGLLAPLGLALRTLNGMLGVVVELVRVFNTMPDPIRKLLGFLLAGYTVMRGMQRLGVTERTVGTAFGFMASPDTQLRQYARTSARAYREATRANFEQATAAQQQQAFGSAAAQQRVSAFVTSPTYQRAVAKGTLDDLRGTPERPIAPLAEQRRMLQSQATVAAQGYTRAARATALAQEEALNADRQLNTVMKLRRAEVAAYLVQSGMPIPADTRIGSLGGVGYLGAGGVGRPGAAGYGTPVQTYGPRSRRMMQQLDNLISTVVAQPGRRASSLDQALAAGGPRPLTREAAEAAGEYADPVTRQVSRTERASRSAVRGLGTATSALGRVPVLMGRLGGALGNLASSIGPLGWAFVGIAGVSALHDAVQKRSKEADDFVRRMEQPGLSESQYNTRLAAARKELEGPSFWRQVYYQLPGVGDAAKAGDEARAKAAGGLTDNESLRKRLQQRAEQQGRPLPQLIPAEVVRRVENDAAMRRSNVLSQQEFDDAMKRHWTEMKTMFEPSRAQIQAVSAAIAAANRELGSRKSYRDALAQMNFQQVQVEQQAVEGNIAAFGPGDRNLSNARDIYTDSIRRMYGQMRGPDAAKHAALLNQQRKSYYDSVSQGVKGELENDLKLAFDPRTREQAYDRAFGRLRGEQSARENAVSRARGAEGKARRGGDEQTIREAVENRENMEKELDAFNRFSAQMRMELRRGRFDDRQKRRQTGLALEQARTPDARQDAAAGLRAARAEVADAESTFGRKSDEYKQALAGVYNARQQAAQATLQHVQAENNLMTAQAGTDPLSQARAAEVEANRTLAAVLKERGRGNVSKDDVTNARADAIRKRRSREDAERDEANQYAQLQGEIAAARAGGDPVLEARAQQQSARRALQSARTRVEKATATRDLIQANNQLQDALGEREAARQRMLASRTDDPVASARAERIMAGRAVGRATPGTAEYYDARTRYNETRRAETQAKLDSARDDIDFDLEMEKISRDAAISRYEELLKGHNLSKQQKREIMRRIKQLKDDASSESSGFNLDVGSIKLPTVYDVRKAFDPVRKSVTESVKAAREALGTETSHIKGTLARQRNGGVQNDLSLSTANMYDQRAQIQAQVNVYVNDRGSVEEVYRALDQVLGTQVKAKARSSGRRKTG